MSSGAALSRRAAARLMMVMRPSPSMPITPALTPDSTVSVKRRRISLRRLAVIKSSRWAEIC